MSGHLLTNASISYCYIASNVSHTFDAFITITFLHLSIIFSTKIIYDMVYQSFTVIQYSSKLSFTTHADQKVYLSPACICTRYKPCTQWYLLLSHDRSAWLVYCDITQAEHSMERKPSNVFVYASDNSKSHDSVTWQQYLPWKHKYLGGHWLNLCKYLHGCVCICFQTD